MIRLPLAGLMPDLSGLQEALKAAAEAAEDAAMPTFTYPDLPEADASRFLKGTCLGSSCLAAGKTIL